MTINLNWGIDWKKILPADGTYKSIGEILYDNGANESALMHLYEKYNTMSYRIFNNILYGLTWDDNEVMLPIPV